MNATRVGKWIFIATMVIASLSFLISWNSDGAGPSQGTPAFVHSPDPEHFPVTLTAWLAGDRIQANEPFWIEYELHNGSSLAARDTQLEPLTNSAWTITEWQEREGNAWTPRGNSFVPRVTLVPGEVRRFRAQAVITGSEAAQTLQTAYSHTWSGTEQERLHNVVVLGPIRVESWTSSFAAALQALITTLMLPMLLSGLAWFLPYAEAKSRAAKAEAEARAAEQNAQASQTWNLLLPYSLEIATKYYMPACSSILAIRREHDRHVATGSYRATFHALLLFMRHMRDCRDQIGGFHFKSRDGEKAARDWWKAINFTLNAEFPLDERDRVLDSVTSTESYSQFVARFQDWKTRDDFAKLETRFNAWCTRTAPVNNIRAFAHYLDLFEMFRAVVQFEVNRPLEYWYRELEVTKEVGDGLVAVKQLNCVEIPDWQGYVDRAGDYLAAIEKEHAARL